MGDVLSSTLGVGRGEVGEVFCRFRDDSRYMHELMRSRFRHGPHGVAASHLILDALQGRQARAERCLR